MSLGFVQASGGEPDLMGVCENDMDRVTLRNIVYSLWAVNKGDGSGGASSCYLGYNVRRLQDRGYLVLAFFGPGFRVSVQDMQLISDVCPLRIDSIFVREPQEGDMKPPQVRKNDAQQPIAAVLSICVLDCNQPVRITEAEVVRVRKRSRGLLLSSLFG